MLIRGIAEYKVKYKLFFLSQSNKYTFFTFLSQSNNYIYNLQGRYEKEGVATVRRPHGRCGPQVDHRKDGADLVDCPTQLSVLGFPFVVLHDNAKRAQQGNLLDQM